MAELGAEVDVRPHDAYGDTVVGRWTGGAGPSLLLVGHMDTVFDPGTAAARPFTIRDGRATGPGVTDMKSGLLAGLYAIAAVRDVAGALPFGRLVFIANPDEEIGSPTSTPHIVEAAADADVCLVLECARANGDIVSERKGILDARIAIGGRAAHAGIEPEKGRSAILAAADLAQRLHALNGRWAGTTINVGVIHGGTRPNVVPERCELEVDVRATSRANLQAAEDEIGRLLGTLAVPDTTATMARMHHWWPMEKLERSGLLVEVARTLAGRLGFELADATTGGASDANTTAGLGVPTLDGLGPIGGLDHSPDEYLEVDSIAPRTALLAGLLLALGRDPDVATWHAQR
jgi:glutamate carboxypeptidase